MTRSWKFRLYLYSPSGPQCPVIIWTFMKEVSACARLHFRHFAWFNYRIKSKITHIFSSFPLKTNIMKDGFIFLFCFWNKFSVLHKTGNTFRASSTILVTLHAWRPSPPPAILKTCHAVVTGPTSSLVRLIINNGNYWQRAGSTSLALQLFVGSGLLNNPFQLIPTFSLLFLSTDTYNH